MLIDMGVIPTRPCIFSRHVNRGRVCDREAFGPIRLAVPPVLRNDRERVSSEPLNPSGLRKPRSKISPRYH